MNVVIVNGSGGCGKTTFEHMVDRNSRHRVYIISTIDFVKHIAELCGWDKTKTEHNRKFLSDLKDLLTEWNDVPHGRVDKELKVISQANPKSIVFIDSREPADINRFKKDWNATTLLIRRPDTNIITSNHADADIENYEYDYYIENDGTEEDLNNKAIEFLQFVEKDL